MMSNDNTVPSTEPIQQGTETPATTIQSMPLGKIAKAKMWNGKKKNEIFLFES
jgi:hypothetical protein